MSSPGSVPFLPCQQFCGDSPGVEGVAEGDETEFPVGETVAGTAQTKFPLTHSASKRKEELKTRARRYLVSANQK